MLCDHKPGTADLWMVYSVWLATVIVGMSRSAVFLSLFGLGLIDYCWLVIKIKRRRNGRGAVLE